MDVNRFYVVLGVAAILISLGISSARGEEIVVSPQTQRMCCGTMAYNVHITNDHKFQRAYDFQVDSLDSDEIWVSLEPKTVLVPSGQEEELMMFVRAECDLPYGEYRIKLTVQKFEEVLEEEVVLQIPSDCARKGPGEAEAQEEAEDGAQEEAEDGAQEQETVDGEAEAVNETDATPTGAAIETEDNAFAIGLLLVLVGILIIILVISQMGSR